MKHTEITQLLGAYALDAVDEDERASITEHLASCPRCRAEVEEHREVATLLAHSGGDAPDGVWRRISESLDDAPPALRLAPAPPSSPSRASAPARLRTMPRVAAGALAAAAVIVALLGIQVRQQVDRIDSLEAALNDPLQSAFRSALEDPESRVITLVSADGTTAVRGAVTGSGVAYLRAAALPELPSDRTYQLWGAAGDQLVSLGVLGSDPGIVTFRGDRYSTFAITEEEAPGVVVTGNPPVVAGTAT